MKLIYTFIALCIASACGNSSNTKPKNEDSASTEAKKFPIETYITDKNGAEVKDKPDVSTKTIATFSCGESLTVTGSEGEWLTVESQTGEGKGIPGYVLKKQTGNLSDIKLTEADLKVTIPAAGSGDKNADFAAKKMTFSLVDEKEFNSKKALATNFLVKDTTTVQKKRGIIELKCGRKTKKYTDKEGEEYRYIGQLEGINKYIIYYENDDHSYMLVDKTNGMETETYSFPLLSADKKHIAGISESESTCDFELYKIENNNIKKVLDISFDNWLQAGNDDDTFWGGDGCLYMPVIYAPIARDGNGNPNKNYQYMRIKIL